MHKLMPQNKGKSIQGIGTELSANIIGCCAEFNSLNAVSLSCKFMMRYYDKLWCRPTHPLVGFLYLRCNSIKNFVDIFIATIRTLSKRKDRKKKEQQRYPNEFHVPRYANICKKK